MPCIRPAFTNVCVCLCEGGWCSAQMWSQQAWIRQYEHGHLSLALPACRVYATVRRPCVCPIRPASARHCYGFAAVGPAPAADISRSLHGRRSAAAASQQHGARQQMRRAVLRCQLTHEAERRRVKLTNIESIMQVVQRVCRLSKSVSCIASVRFSSRASCVMVLSCHDVSCCCQCYDTIRYEMLF